MSSSSFPLLQLPFVPLKMVTDHLALDQLIAISHDPFFFKVAGIKPEAFNLTLDRFGWSIRTSKTNREDDSTHDVRGREIVKEDPSHISWFWPAETMEVRNKREIRRQEDKVCIEKFLKVVKIKEGLIVSGPGRAIIDIKRYNTEYVRNDYSDWIHFEVFIDIKARVVLLNRTLISEVALNFFFNYIKDVCPEMEICTKMEILTIKKYTQHAPWNRRALMNGLGARRETNFKLHLPKPSKSIVEKFYPVTMEQLEQGIDLGGADSFDRVDGRTCSVVVNKHELVMYVYNK